MSDDRTKRGAADRARINMSQEHEVKYWTEKFGVTREKLQEAINAAGTMASSVEQRLRSGRSK